MSHPIAVYPVLEPDRMEVNWPILSGPGSRTTPPSIPLVDLERAIQEALAAPTGD